MNSRGPASILDLASVQGIVVSGYGDLLGAIFVLLRIEEPEAARAWLGRLEVTSGTHARDVAAVNVALTFEGIRRLGLDPSADFPLEFRQGMHAPAARSRRLGDEGDSAPENWQWGGPRFPVHLVLMLYATDTPAVERCYRLHQERFSDAGLSEVVKLDSHALRDAIGFKEHFGFRDGLSQPVVRNGNGLADPPGLLASGRQADRLEPGEFLLGYPNEYGNLPETPTVPAETDPARWLVDSTDRPGRRELGGDGTYLVFRQLEQDVRGFWKSVTRGAGDDDPRWVAAKMVGRWPNGTPLVESPRQEGKNPRGNEFGYREKNDAHGLKCPLGSHIRRSNPRDALGDDAAESIGIVKRHRLLRRGRTYGSPLDLALDPQKMLDAPDRGTSRGLHFLCINTSISRQFEFVQHTWLNGSELFGLDGEVDPLVGRNRLAAPRFTIQDEPLRRRIHDLPRFVTVRGGAYFFLPSLRAIRYLAALEPGRNTLPPVGLRGQGR